MQRDKTTRDGRDLDGLTPVHPSANDWMDWLYGELPSERHAPLEAHLAACPECKLQVSAWKGAMKDLGAWQVASPSNEAKPARPWWSDGWKWAAAAMMVLAAFLAGRDNSMPRSAQLSSLVAREVASQIQSTRAELATNVKTTIETNFESIAQSNRAEMARLFSDLTATIKEGRAADQENVLAALKEMDARWLTIYASFRRELETVAILTETGLKDTQQQLVQMTDFNETKRTQ